MYLYRSMPREGMPAFFNHQAPFYAISKDFGSSLISRGSLFSSTKPLSARYNSCATKQSKKKKEGMTNQSTD
jgi:hypothetical protein